MKKQLFTGLLLILLTLCSCSRKKTQTAEAVQTAETVQAAEVVVSSEVEEQTSVEPSVEEDVEIDEEFLAEEERYGTEVLSFLEDESNFTSPIIENTESESSQNNNETVPQVETVEKRLIDSYNRLKVMEYGSELFLPVTKEDSSVLIHYSNKAAVRLFYDELFRLTKKEYWKMESVENARITGTELYSYNGDEKKPFEKKIETETSIFVSKLNENGLVISTEKYAVNGNSPISTTTWSYDEKNRITSETVSEAENIKKQVFIYTKVDKLAEDSDEIPPDYEYYENGVLRTKTEYSKKGTYSTTIIFDSIYSVKTDYENYMKVRDVYYENGVQRRVKDYE